MIKKFLYIIEDIVLKDDIIPNLSVGIVEKEEDDYCLVNFVSKTDSYRVSKNIIRYFNPLETGDAFPYKICNLCHRILPTDDFEKNQIGKGDRILRRPSCRNCRKEIDGMHLSTKNKKKWEINKPNMDLFTCPICHKKFISGVTCKVVLDHDHTTGLPRAWVCNSCNTSIGQFRDNVNILKEVINYLENKNN